MNNIFGGTGVAIVTPFLADGQIDYPAFEQILTYFIANKIDYVVVLGSTGEALTISSSEKKQLLEFAAKVVNQRIPIVAGFSNSDTAALVQEIKTSNFKGISGILTASPAYNKPTQEGIYQHFKQVAQCSPVPVILYNVPGRTAGNMLPDTVIRLANDFENIVGIKEASGNLIQCMELVARRPADDFALLSGDDFFALPLIASGFDGLISVMANAYPSMTADLVDTTRKSNLKEAQSLHYQLLPFIHLLFAENNPAGIKMAMHLLGLCTPHLRLPLLPASNALKNQLIESIQQLGKPITPAQSL